MALYFFSILDHRAVRSELPTLDYMSWLPVTGYRGTHLQRPSTNHRARNLRISTDQVPAKDRPKAVPMPDSAYTLLYGMCLYIRGNNASTTVCIQFHRRKSNTGQLGRGRHLIQDHRLRKILYDQPASRGLISGPSPHTAGKTQTGEAQLWTPGTRRRVNLGVLNGF